MSQSIYYVVRQGWNAANQSSAWAKANPKNEFESRRLQLVAIVEAGSEQAACQQFAGSVYANQTLFATRNPRSIRGLTKAIEQFETEGANHE